MDALGPIIVAVALIVAFPVAFLMGSAVITAIFGWVLKDDAEQRYEGSELLEINK